MAKKIFIIQHDACNNNNNIMTMIHIHNFDGGDIISERGLCENGGGDEFISEHHYAERQRRVLNGRNVVHVHAL